MLLLLALLVAAMRSLSSPPAPSGSRSPPAPASIRWRAGLAMASWIRSLSSVAEPASWSRNHACRGEARGGGRRGAVSAASAAARLQAKECVKRRSEDAKGEDSSSVEQ